MSILIVEYIAPIEHSGYVSFNVRCLESLNTPLFFYTHDEFFKSCSLSGVKRLIFPTWLHCKTRNKFKPVLERLQGIVKLLMVKNHISRKHYDAVIFTSYDIMSLWVFRTNLPVYIVNHNNTSDFKSPIKRWLHQRLPSNFTHIALATFIADYIKGFTRLPIHVVPHGLTKIYDKTISLEGNVCDGKYIYCPSTSSCNTELLNKIIESDEVNHYLQANSIKLVIKSYTLKTTCNNVIVISDYIDDILYKKIMAGALVVFAPYTEDSFQYRVSAVLMECIGSKIPIISTYSQAYMAYSEFINYKFIVDSPDSFIESIKEILSMSERDYYKSIELLDPTNYWRQLLHK